MGIVTRQLSSNLSATTGTQQQKRADIEEIANLSAIADSEIIDRAVALAQLLKLGAATCRDLDEYNKVALDVWRVNIRVWQMMIRAGADRSKLAFPFQPPLFTPQVNESIECAKTGNSCSVSVESPCAGGEVAPRTAIFTHESNEQANLFSSLQPESASGLNGVGSLELAFGIVLALWAVGFLAATGAAVWLTVTVLDALPSSQLNQAKTDYNRMIPRIGAARTKAMLDCIKSDTPFSECRNIVNEAFPTPTEPSGFLSGFIGTGIKIGGVFLLGSYIFKKIKED